MAGESNKTKIQIALAELERTNDKYRNEKSSRSNERPVGDSNRKEEDLSEIQKAHLRLLETNVHAAIAKEFMEAMKASSISSNALGNKVYWLNWIIVFFTGVLALSAIFELTQ